VSAAALSAGIPQGGPSPWWTPYRDWRGELLPVDTVPPELRLARLNRLADERGVTTDSGLPLRFVEATRAVSGEPYEVGIARTGQVPTRCEGPGARHDLYNALAWLRFPRIKSRLNALQAARIAADGIGGRRGAVRDALTLFDENALLWVTEDPAPTRALVAFDWPTLFAALRDGVVVDTWVFGHALLEKLDAPYKAITAHAWPVCLAAGACLDRVDAEVAKGLSVRPPSPDRLCPLPVMGLPGWCEANADPSFYDDPAVFRAGRRRGNGQRRGAAAGSNDTNAITGGAT